MNVPDAIVTAIRIKGFVSPSDLAFCLGISADEANTEIEHLRSRELISESRLGFKLTEVGKSAAARVIEKERAAVDAGELEAAYELFDSLNGPLKDIITAWQSREIDGEEVPNDHSDSTYDASVISDLESLDDKARDLFVALAELKSRLKQYGPRFQRAMLEIRSGNSRFVAAPILDSYHTIWFELHEDLITLSGRTRADEASKGKAL